MHEMRSSHDRNSPSNHVIVRVGPMPPGLVRLVGSQIYPDGPPLRDVVQDTVRTVKPQDWLLAFR